MASIYLDLPVEGGGGGKNTNHRTMETGMHAGDTAIGTCGLTPLCYG